MFRTSLGIGLHRALATSDRSVADYVTNARLREAAWKLVTKKSRVRAPKKIQTKLAPGEAEQACLCSLSHGLRLLVRRDRDRPAQAGLRLIGAVGRQGPEQLSFQAQELRLPQMGADRLLFRQALVHRLQRLFDLSCSPAALGEQGQGEIQQRSEPYGSL